MLDYTQELIPINVVLVNTDHGEYKYDYFMKITYYRFTSIIAHTGICRFTPPHLRIDPAPVL